MKMGIGKSRGSAMAEFAIVLPLLILLLFGMIEFGVALYNQAVISNASREGARWAASYYINPSNSTASQPLCSDIQNYILNDKYVNLKEKLISLSDRDPFTLIAGCCGSSCTPKSTNWSGNGYDNENVWNGSSNGVANSVTVQYTHQFLVFGKLVNFLGGSSCLKLNATTVMRDDNQN